MVPTQTYKFSIMLGQNPKRSPVNSDGNVLDVKSIFRTVQGEGPFAGVPAVFIRLGGCNLACKFCDTEFEDFTRMLLDDILQEVQRLTAPFKTIKLLVITGGEPFRQNILPLCQKLLQKSYQLQIETNGTLYQDLPTEVNIVCSPKPPATGYTRLREDLLPRVSAVKFLISTTIEKYSRIGEIGQTDYNIPVFLQPMDQNNEEINKQNIALAIELAYKTGYRVSHQLHKIWGIE